MNQIVTEKGVFMLIELSNNSYNTKEIKGNSVVFKTSGWETVVNVKDNSKFIGLSKEITEEQAKGIVSDPSGNENEGYFGYRDYATHEWVWCLETAKISFHSLLKVNGFDLEKNYLIYKKP